MSERIMGNFNLYMLPTFVMTMYYLYTYRIVIFKIYTLPHINSMSWDLSQGNNPKYRKKLYSQKCSCCLICKRKIRVTT